MKMAGTVGVGIVCAALVEGSCLEQSKRKFGNCDFHDKIKHIDCIVFVMIHCNDTTWN